MADMCAGMGGIRRRQGDTSTLVGDGDVCADGWGCKSRSYRSVLCRFAVLLSMLSSHVQIQIPRSLRLVLALVLGTVVPSNVDVVLVRLVRRHGAFH